MGRPKGRINNSFKLDGAEIGITIMILHGISVNRIAKLYGVHRKTVHLFIQRKKLCSEKNIQFVLSNKFIYVIIILLVVMAM